MTTHNKTSAPNPTPRLSLPRLSAAEACLLADALQALLYALWRAHGDDLADYFGMLGEQTPRPPSAVWASDNPDDQDFPF